MPIRVSLAQPSSSREQSGHSSVNIICAFLPSSDHHTEEFTEYLNDLVSIISLESCAPLINPRRACAGGLRYLSCVCVCVCVCVCLSVPTPAPTSILSMLKMRYNVCRGLA